MLNKLENTDAEPKTRTSIKPKQSIFDNKAFRIGAILALALAVATVVVAILSMTTQSTIKDDFFVSDDTKTAISLTPDNGESGANGLMQTHFVYAYDGDNVSGLKTYFEYPDEETAKSALESIKDQPEFTGAVVEDKYIVVTADENQYKGLTRLDIEQQAEALKALQENKQKSQNSENDS